MDGLRLLETARWSAARDAFEAVLAHEDAPDARDGLGRPRRSVREP